jgi:hypothetical protein
MVGLYACVSALKSEPLKRRLAVRQCRGAISILHRRQHGSNMRHRSIQLIRDGTVNVA